MLLRMMKYITVAGLIATHSAAPFHGTIWIEKKTGLIYKVTKKLDPKADHVYGDDCLIFAGFSDIHIHAREDETGKQTYKETYLTASNAALNGGVICTCAMPNTPNPVTTQLRFDWHRKCLAKLNHAVTTLNYLGIDKNTSPIGKPGEHMYKLYFGKSVGDLTVTFESELDEILSRYRRHSISFHVEYEPVILAAAGGKTHTDRRPVESVSLGLRILLPLIEKYKIDAKLCHWSIGRESFKLIEEYRARGCKITLEVSPLHLFFSFDDAEKDPEWWTKIQMNPAVQRRIHQMDLIAGLKSGFIQFIATDHAPHTEDEKFSAFAKFANDYPHTRNTDIAAAIKKKDIDLYLRTCEENNHSGAPWLDTYSLVCVWLMKVHGFTPQDIARVSAYNPGAFVNRFLKTQFPKRNFGKGFGEIRPNFMGSLTVLNTEKETLVRREDLKTNVRWSALEGMTLPGAVEAVFTGGVLQ